MMWQQVVIGVAVVLAAGYVVWTFLSLRMRQRLLDGLAARGIMTGYAAAHRARLNIPGCSNCSAAEAHPSHRRQGSS
jgi:hypothetical protein